MAIKNIKYKHIRESTGPNQLIIDKIFIEDFGDCKGMGWCGTCIVTVTNWKSKEPLKERNEAATLAKAGSELLKKKRLGSSRIVKPNKLILG